MEQKTQRAAKRKLCYFFSYWHYAEDLTQPLPAMIRNAVIDVHPLEWQRSTQDAKEFRNGTKRVIAWQEMWLTQEEFTHWQSVCF